MNQLKSLIKQNVGKVISQISILEKHDVQVKELFNTLNMLLLLINLFSLIYLLCQSLFTYFCFHMSKIKIKTLSKKSAKQAFHDGFHSQKSIYFQIKTRTINNNTDNKFDPSLPIKELFLIFEDNLCRQTNIMLNIDISAYFND